MKSLEQDTLCNEILNYFNTVKNPGELDQLYLYMECQTPDERKRVRGILTYLKKKKIVNNTRLGVWALS